MSRANRLGMYADVRQILDSALASGGGDYTLPDHGTAVHWRQRAYRFRKLFAETISGVSQYDKLTFPRIGPEDNTVVIRLIQPKGVFTPAANAPEPIVDDDLLDVAAALAAKLDGDIL